MYYLYLDSSVSNRILVSNQRLSKQFLAIDFDGIEINDGFDFCWTIEGSHYPKIVQNYQPTLIATDDSLDRLIDMYRYNLYIVQDWIDSIKAYATRSKSFHLADILAIDLSTVMATLQEAKKLDTNISTYMQLGSSEEAEL